MFFDTDPTHGVYCPTGCDAKVTAYLADSLNFGNILALCEPAEREFDYTPPSITAASLPNRAASSDPQPTIRRR
jgi:hypothetical protein